MSLTSQLDNVTLALDLLCDVGVTLSSVKPQGEQRKHTA